jgi:hypothetical protein
VVIVAAGDIACGQASTGAKCKEGATSDLIIAQNPAAVLALGDVQYECGEIADFNLHFDHTWGRFKSKIRPAIGNHEYNRGTNCPNAPDGAPGYWAYFGDASTPRQPGCPANCQGYYSYDVGSWHIIALNSVCSKAGGCQAGSPQEKWLRADMAAHPNTCTLAYMHHPLFSSGQIGNQIAVKDLWQAFYDNGGDVILVGHDHNYERFAPQTSDGQLDTKWGVQEFVVGTGGRNTSGQGTIRPNSLTRNFSTFGILKMVLRPTGYDWQFVPIAGSSFTDSGTANCHGLPGSADASGAMAFSATQGNQGGSGALMATVNAGSASVSYSPSNTGDTTRAINMVADQRHADPLTILLTALPAVAFVGSTRRRSILRRRLGRPRRAAGTGPGERRNPGAG